MIPNILEIFKEEDPRMEEYGGKGRILFHRDCTGRSFSYDVKKINQFFKEGTNPDHMLERMVSIMHYLQQGFHTEQYESKAGEYEHANEEYPKRYLALVNGLDDDALNAIRHTQISNWTSQLPDDLGKQFYEQLIRDKNTLKVAVLSSNNATTLGVV